MSPKRWVILLKERKFVFLLISGTFNRRGVVKSIEELLDLYRQGKIPEALLLRHFTSRIPEESIERLLSLLTPEERVRWHLDLVAVSNPEWIGLDGWVPPPETRAAIREYLRKLGSSSNNWPI